MGFHISLMLISIENKKKFLQLANLQEGGAEDEWNERPFSAVEYNNNWLVWMNWHDGMLDEKNYAQISNSLPLLTCDLSEGSMFSACRSWSNGQELWSIAHDGSSGGELEINGSLPAEAIEIIATKRTAQSEETNNIDHLFNAPIDLFVALGGMQYDLDHNLPFRELERVEQTSLSELPASSLEKSPWWKFW